MDVSNASNYNDNNKNGHEDAEAGVSSSKRMQGEKRLPKAERKKLKREMRRKEWKEKKDMKRKVNLNDTRSGSNDNISTSVSASFVASASSEGIDGAGGKRRREGRNETKESIARACNRNGFNIIIDLSFDHLMNENEIKSMSQQISIAQSESRNSFYPVKIIVHDDNQKDESGKSDDKIATLKRLVDSNQDVWQTFGCYEYKKSSIVENNQYPLDSLVYLSSEAESVLSTLESGKNYIIGGIVDRNRHKGLTYEKAKRLNIKTAKLPLPEDKIKFIARVLTTNHVIRMLLDYSEVRNWNICCSRAIPKRKIKLIEENQRKKNLKDGKIYPDGKESNSYNDSNNTVVDEDGEHEDEHVDGGDIDSSELNKYSYSKKDVPIMVVFNSPIFIDLLKDESVCNIVYFGDDDAVIKRISEKDDNKIILCPGNMQTRGDLYRLRCALQYNYERLDCIVVSNINEASVFEIFDILRNTMVRTLEKGSVSVIIVPNEIETNQRLYKGRNHDWIEKEDNRIHFRIFSASKVEDDDEGINLNDIIKNNA